MVREVDIRNHNIDRATPERALDLGKRVASVNETLPGSHTVMIGEVDPRTGNASLVRSLKGPAVEGDLVNAALRHVQAVAPLLGFDATISPEFRPDSQVLSTSAGAVAVHLQQTVYNIPIFQASLTVQVGSDRVIQAIVGAALTPSEIASPTPSVSPADALIVAARHLARPSAANEIGVDQFGEPLAEPAINLSAFAPAIQSSEDDGDRETVLDAPPFTGPVRGALIWFDIDNVLALGWEFIISLPDGISRYRAIVDAHDGRLLYCHLLTFRIFAQGNIAFPDAGKNRQLRDFPLSLSNYTVPRPSGLSFPRQDWVASDRTEGNHATAHLVGGGTAQGATVNNIMTFNPASASGNDQLRVALHFFCGYMHDFLYLLGFREADGNFQEDNYGLGGAGSDRVDATVHPGAVIGTANMGPTADGTAPPMNMGLVTSTSRHTALDSNVVFHEYTHGLTNRLVGGAADESSLDAIQSGSMGEGWSDYVACTLDKTTVVGSWVVNNTAGIRGFPYDSSFPDDYGMLGTGRYTEVHNNGEIWCAALMQLGRQIGAVRAIQVVVDGLKLTPANPTYLQARDAILTALQNKAQVENWGSVHRRLRQRQAWEAFAKFGMGVRAQGGPATTLTGIVGDTSVPDDQFAPVYQMGSPGSGIGGYDLADDRDSVFAFD
jgi:extracellular elastinolytic metalloproteinase